MQRSGGHERNHEHQQTNREKPDVLAAVPRPPDQQRQRWHDDNDLCEHQPVSWRKQKIDDDPQLMMLVCAVDLAPRESLCEGSQLLTGFDIALAMSTNSFFQFL